MSVGWQEILALLLVALVLSTAVYRRWKKSRAPAAGCNGCTAAEPQPPKEATLRFYRRQR